MPNIVEFLAHLSRDQAARDAFNANPHQTMVDFGLNGGQIKLLDDANGQPSGSSGVDALEKALKGEYGGMPMAGPTTVSMTTKLSYP
jgi:hypothetical protein